MENPTPPAYHTLPVPPVPLMRGYVSPSATRVAVSHSALTTPKDRQQSSRSSARSNFSLNLTALSGRH
uniref:Uncharacterized protein n=1 Tax=Anopheles albimanus TaxID=7167 RepID=A0A182FIF1_ANOAL